MKRMNVIAMICGLCLCLTGCSTQGGTWIFGILGILVLAFAVLRTYSAVQYNRSRRRKRRRKAEAPEQILLTVIIYALALVLILNGNYGII